LDWIPAYVEPRKGSLRGWPNDTQWANTTNNIGV